MAKETKLDKWFETKEPTVSEKTRKLQDDFDNIFGDMLKQFKIKSFKEERIGK